MNSVPAQDCQQTFFLIVGDEYGINGIEWSPQFEMVQAVSPYAAARQIGHPIRRQLGAGLWLLDIKRGDRLLYLATEEKILAERYQLIVLFLSHSFDF